jgi:hypothetical protein
VLTGIVTLLVVLVGLVAPTASVADYAPRPARATWVPNAPVYAVAVRGDHAYIGGSFTSLRDARTGETVTRTRLARISLSSGELDRGWVATANDTVRAMAVSGDGTNVFVGGNFTTVNGQARGRIASLTTASGGLTAGWNASANNIVRAVAVHGGLVYFGGFFTSVNGVSRLRAAAVAEANGALSGFDPRADSAVWAISPSVDGSSILLGGRFTSLRGTVRTYLGSVDPSTGVPTAWAPPPACTSTSQPCFVLDLAPKDGGVYAAIAGPGGRVTAFDASTGAIRWHARGDGDVQSVAVDDRLVYVGGHYGPTFGGGTRYNLAAVEQTTGALDPDFAPAVSTLYPGVWDLVTTPSHLVAGGGFTNIGGTGQSRVALLPALGDTTETAVPRGSVWRYSTAAQSTGWASPIFDDSTWPSGTTQIGYGDGDEATVVGRVFTVYARRVFSVSAVSSVTRLSLRLLRDDGAVVYLNGTEVARSNMPSGTITPTTPASSTVATTAESTYYAFTLPPELLREGANVLAVEVHQESASSSDVSLDAELVLSR